jgi:biopolymer transport protein ExbD
MAGVDTAAPRGHEKKKKKRRKMRRLSIRIDMTPMVDVAFLLLTFFMLTTSMSRPQTMEINIPPSNTNVEVGMSNLMTLRVKEDGTIYWNIGIDDPKKIERKELKKFMEQQITQNPKLITLIKIDRKGKYAMMVDIMDDLNEAKISRFSLAPMEEIDKKILSKVAA